MSDPKPICVDLDGTLIFEDVTLLALKIFVRRNPLNLLKALGWFLRGRAHLKKMLALNVDIDVGALNYNKKLLDFLKNKKQEGHRLFLATACDQRYAHKIANFIPIFDGVFASDGKINLRANAKANTLEIMFGRNFIYAGNSVDDVMVWSKSAECILVNPTKSALRGMRGRRYLLLKDCRDPQKPAPKEF
ncbi:MAG: hypothetical protein LBT70_04095 [Holosporaceae bacterium]|jgi:hydroxymethylpyrimidine pyrophosphatase-like HAD family hydrolase|nr:hypothetical protein [Holosporaceae bacterium]